MVVDYDLVYRKMTDFESDAGQEGQQILKTKSKYIKFALLGLCLLTFITGAAVVTSIACNLKGRKL